jgi:HD-like signal output (HDOD) protein
MSRLSRSFPGITSDIAYTFGLFMDCGIAVLIQKFPAYKQTLAVANSAVDRRFTAIEEEAHQTNHAAVGYWLARSWHLEKDLADAIRFHHEYEILADDLAGQTQRTRHLVAFGLLSEHLIQCITGMNRTVEWAKGAPYVKSYLGLTDEEIAELVLEAREFFE